MRYRKAFAAGILGGAAMSALLALGRALGFPVNFAMIEGSLLLREVSAAAFVVGEAVHLAISGAIALLYGAGFEHLLHRSGWFAGVLFAGVHTVASGLALAVVPDLHPLVPEAIAAPGAFLSNLGPMGPLVLLLTHLIYGGIVGNVYGPLSTPSAEA